MVSLWPWKRSDDSPASFEKVLSALATKIANTQAKLDRTRATSRRARVLCTLYLTFGYLVYAIVLVLVVGWKNMGPWEWSGIAGGPVLIYATRKALAAVYNFRIDSLASKLKEQQGERAKTIQKLKDATKYDSTLQLLEKYGGAEPKAGKGKGAGGDNSGQEGKRGSKGGAAGGPGGNPSTPNRTRLPPPPTANIQHGGNINIQTPSSKQGTPRSAADDTSIVSAPGSPAGGVTDLSASAEFAPNAFGPDEVAAVPQVTGGQYAVSAPSAGGGAAAVYGESHWYDRILDALMGDDETAAKNRFVLICSSCRLVNGQAPPGTKSLAELGSWRCMGCGALNGEAAEAKKIVREMLQRNSSNSNKVTEVADSEAESDNGDSIEAEVDPETIEVKEEEDNQVATGKDSTNTRNLRKRGKKAK
ncbi:hypothetical protein Sste5346_007066 [Sporothrix stenoceras]|uniref:Endoplasmic reticulum junction formation protein lunapark n=1 Tax=Sporothrix stenoceras TaxID=5173 RepID=A0ABR3YVC7_9PEZI